MWIMAAHEMMTLGGSVSGSVDATYVAADVCDGDPSTPIRVDSGVVSLAITGTSMAVNGLVVANHNLDTADSVGFSGLGTVIMPTVPPGGIRLNGVEMLAGSTTTGSTTVTVTTTGPAIIGEVFAGLFREVRTLPPRSDYPFRPFQITPEGEYGGLSYSKGAQSRGFGGSVYVTTADKAILEAAYLASRENSLPTVIVPFCDAIDALVVTWNGFNPRPVHLNIGGGLWYVDVQWIEVPRYRWPA